jgi:hypothetical protein
VAGGGNTNQWCTMQLHGFPACCLTRRSSGPTAACHQAPATGTLYIFCGRGLASCRCGPLTSNVRHHEDPSYQTCRVSPLAIVHANFLVGLAHTREDRKFLHCSGNFDSSLPANPARKVISLNPPQSTLATAEGANACELPPRIGAHSKGRDLQQCCNQVHALLYRQLPRKASSLNPPPSNLVTPEGVNRSGGRRKNQPVNHRAFAQPPLVMPNPSLKRSANGRPPGPPGGVVYHPSVGPGVLPSSPA